MVRAEALAGRLRMGIGAWFRRMFGKGEAPAKKPMTAEERQEAIASRKKKDESKYKL